MTHAPHGEQLFVERDSHSPSLVSYHRAAHTSLPSEMDAPTLTELEFQQFLDLIYRVAGIRIPPTKRVLVTNRLRRRLRATGIDGFAKYYALLTSPAGKDEMPRFLDEITTNETYFFRDPHQFTWFREEFLPQIAQQAQLRKRPKTLRVWSAAASTGAELYSAAICLLEQKAAFAGWSIAFLGTDLSGAVLQSAREGAFDQRDLRLVSPEQRRRFFDEDKAKQRWVVKPEVKALATWKTHNLMRKLPEAPFDCIFLKNVLIYFDATSKQVVARHVMEALGKCGHLVLGPTEVLSQMLPGLEKRKSWLYQRPGS